MTASKLTYDKIFKAILANPVCIRQMLHTYVCRAEILDGIDFGQMEQLSAEFVDPSTQRSYYGDMLWKIGYRDPRRDPLYLVLLLELQSTSCRYMALRMNNYMTQFYLRMLKTSAAQENSPLPQVLPVVFYTGWNAWTGPMEACELIENHGAGLWSSEPFYRFRFKLLDIPRMTNKTEKNSPLWLLVDCLQTNTLDKLRKKWHNLKRVLPSLGHPLYQEAWVQLFGIVFEHITEGDMSAELSIEAEYPQYTMKDLDDRLDAEGNMIDWRQRYLDQGRNEGKIIGRAEGKTEGRSEERLSILQQVLLGKFGDISAEQMKAVFEYRDEPDLFARIIKADSPEELLQSLR